MYCITIAESNETIVVDNNHYFPDSALVKDFFKPSDMHSTCGWKGEACYYSIVVDGKENKDAAWFYADPKPAAVNIKDSVAFWKDVTIQP